MSALAEIEHSIESLLSAQPYEFAPEDHESSLLMLLKQELVYACDRNPRFRNYVDQWPTHFREVERVSDLPYLPVAAFKRNPPLSLVAAEDIKRTLSSSSTSGQVPSRVVLDFATSRRMTKGVARIIRDFIGPTRRPYLVVDTRENLVPGPELSARGAAIQSLQPFATETVCCLRSERGELFLEIEKLLEHAAKWRGTDVLVYGFTFLLWTQFVQRLKRQGVTLNLPNAYVLHSGGWKLLQDQAVTKDAFIDGVASIFECSPDRVIDYYGMVESVGVVFPDCRQGNKHVPAFADVVVRNPLTMLPVDAGQRGLVQVCSVLPTSSPAFLLLTDDIAEVIGDDGCACGRRGTYFRFVKRAPRAEARGCGNLQITRH